MLVDGEKLKTAMLFKMRDLIEVLPGTDSGFTFNLKLFDKLVKKNQVPLQPPARIEAAIRYIEKRVKDESYIWEWLTGSDIPDLLRYFLGQEQETWTDKDFEETKN